jgi:hypothetical protein
MPTQVEQTAVTVDEQAQVLDTLAHPDPDPDSLPILREDTALALQEQTAGHLIRAIMRQGEIVEKLKQAMNLDMLAWAEVIAGAEGKQTNWRIIVRDWMLRNDVTKLQAPWFTASLAKGRTKIVVDDELGVILVCKAMKATEAVKTIEKLDKKAFDVIWNSAPNQFKSLAHEETGDPSLVIRRKEA